jgi:hypothetical protein
MIAYCGLKCDSCLIHMATLEQDLSRQREMRISIARQCTEQYGMKLQPEDVTDCDGCKANTGRLFSGCSKCGISKCANQRDIESCAFCKDYACERLQDFFNHDPEAKIRLEEIRNTNTM